MRFFRSKHLKAHQPGSCSAKRSPACSLELGGQTRQASSLIQPQACNRKAPKSQPWFLSPPPPAPLLSSFQFSFSISPPPKLTRARNHGCSVQCARAAPGASGSLLPLQWFTDNPALLSECAVDGFPPVSSHLCHSGRA